MVLLDEFFIKFDDKWGTYAPGGKLTGKVHISTQEALFCDSITVQCCGAARIFWMQKEHIPLYTSNNQESFDDLTRLVDSLQLDDISNENQPVIVRNVAYRNEKVYFNMNQTVWKCDVPSSLDYNEQIDLLIARSGSYGLHRNAPVTGDEAEPKLGQGKHEFSFEFILPDNLPSSFDGANQSCSVRYFVKAQIKQLNLTKLVRKEHFTVVKKVDLNMFPTSLIPTTIIADCSNPIQKQCLCFIFYNIDRISTINASMKLQKCAFVPTESTVVDIKFSCFWHETLSQITLSLVRNVHCIGFSEISGTRGKCTKTIMGSVEFDKDSLRNGKFIWSPTLIVPAATPTMNDEPELMSVTYELVLAFMDQSGIVLELNAPIVIGTITAKHIQGSAVDSEIQAVV